MNLPAPFVRLMDRLQRAWRERGISLKAASFAVIGVVNTLIDLGVFLVAYNVLALSLVPANVLAWLVAVSGSYVMNSFITFAAESGQKLRLRDYGTFVASGVAGVITNTRCSSSCRIGFRFSPPSCWRSWRASWSTSRCRISWCFARATAAWRRRRNELKFVHDPGGTGIRPNLPSGHAPLITRCCAMALYDAFVSYSHAKDKPIAAALQSVVQKLGKPWYRRRALRVFRDDTSLSATPSLWPSIEQALGQSRFLILIASPEAAASTWVNKEVALLARAQERRHAAGRGDRRRARLGRERR